MLKLRESLVKTQEWVISIVLIIMTVVIFIQVLNRHTLALPLPWTEEIGKIMLLLVTYLGLAATFNRDYHIRVDLLDFILRKGKIEKVTKIVGEIIISVFGVLIIYLSYDYLTKQMAIKQATIVLGIPLWILIASILISGVLIAINALITLYLLVSGRE